MPTRTFHSSLSRLCSLLAISEFCRPCNESLAAQEKQSQLTYTDATVYVRKITVSEENDNSPDSSDKNSENDNMDAFNGGGDIKRKKSKPNNNLMKFSSSAPTAKKDSDMPRRSTRRRKHKDEREFKISATDTLKDLKIRVSNLAS